jgi:arginase
MDVQLFQVPYDSGQRGARMGKGPLAFVEHGLSARLQEQGWRVKVVTIEAVSPFRAEIRTAFELCRSLAQQVQPARARGAFPLILSGNCISSLGGIAGVDPAGLGVIWFDAHPDFHTPETTAGGMLDSMGLAIATGHCWTTITQFIPGFVALPGNQVLLVGPRQIDAEDPARLQQAEITLLRGEAIRAAGFTELFVPALAALARRVQRVYIHLDLDVLDPTVGTANSFALPGGLFVPELEQTITLIAQRFEIAGAAFTAYDPDCDPEETIFRAGVHLMEHLLQQVEQSRGRA